MGKFVGSLLGTGDITSAANRAAEDTQAAALRGANIAAFRPVGVTSRFGTSQFGMENVEGVPRVTSAGYTVAPDIAAIRDRLLGFAGAQGIGQVEQIAPATAGLFGLGAGYLASTPEQARQQYINEQLALLEPIRAREEQRLASTAFGRGRAGLNIGDIGQPDLAAYAAANRAQDLQLAAQAEQAAQQRIGFGADLFGLGLGLQTQALGPLQSYVGTAQTLEELGQQPLQLGLAIGGAAQPGATAGAQLLSSGLQQAAQTRFAGQQAATAANAQFLSGLISAGTTAYGGSQGWFKK